MDLTSSGTEFGFELSLKGMPIFDCRESWTKEYISQGRPGRGGGVVEY